MNVILELVRAVGPWSFLALAGYFASAVPAEAARQRPAGTRGREATMLFGYIAAGTCALVFAAWLGVTFFDLIHLYTTFDSKGPS